MTTEIITTEAALRAGAVNAMRLGWDREKWLRCVQKAYLDQRGRDHGANMPSRQGDDIEARTHAANRVWLEVGGRE